MRRIKREVGLKDPLPLLDHRRYKYLASLDGNGWANRLPFLLALGSAVFKQDSPFFTWWYPLMQPMIHFVPLERDLNNTIEMVNWARSNDVIIRNISRSGRSIVNDFLMDMGDVYMCKLLKTYASMYSQV